MLRSCFLPVDTLQVRGRADATLQRILTIFCPASEIDILGAVLGLFAQAQKGPISQDWLNG